MHEIRDTLPTIMLRYPSSPHRKRRRLHLRRLLPLGVTFLAAVICLSSYLLFASSSSSRQPSSIRQHQPQAVVDVETTFSQKKAVNDLPFDVTLVTQTSKDRSWLLHYFCRRWAGPISVSVLTDDRRDPGARISQVATVASCSSPLRDEPIALDTYAWQEDQGAIVEIATFRQGRLRLGLFAVPTNSTTSYPINALRNAALMSVSTSHLLVLDVDFLPSAELYDAILSQRSVLTSSQFLAMVVPAFQKKGDKKFKDVSLARWRELSTSEGEELVPSTVARLAACVATGGCVVFDSTWNPDAHSTTDSAAWLEQASQHANLAARGAAMTLRHRPIVVGRDAPASVTEAELVPSARRLECFDSNRFEPYVVLSRKEAPLFDEDFVGYGKNKIEYVARLRYSGFSFAVLPVGFVCHAPHPISRDKRKWLKQKRGSHDTDRLYKSSVDEMVRGLRPDGRNRTWLCDSKSPGQKAKDPRKKKKPKKSATAR